jgi:hypothetical protein
MKVDAVVFQTDDGVDKIGNVKAGEIFEATSGRVHVEPGRLKVVFKHGDWKVGQIVGLYSEIDSRGKAKVGTVSDLQEDDLRFISRGSKCLKPSKDCWASLILRPTSKWMIKFKLPNDLSGWIDSTQVETDQECNL